MTKCIERGCRNLATICQDCGRTVSTANLDNWISCKESLPKAYKHVLVCKTFKSPQGEKTYVEMMYYFPEENNWRDIDNYYPAKQITHWMALPEPPRTK